jgi:two-component system sensor histidine kinase/response regulator
VQGAVEQNISIAPLEFQIACKDGGVCTVVISGIIIGTDVLATFFDITDRKAAEEALRARERYQRALLDNFPFMVWLKDTDGRILAANKVYAQVANVADPDELIGATGFDYWEAEQAEHYRAQESAVLESGQPMSVEEEENMEAGRQIWIETYRSPVKLDGRIIGTVGFARDITERKQAEAELQLWAQAFRVGIKGKRTELPCLVR